MKREDRMTAHYSQPVPLIEVPERPDWHARARCAGMHDWYDMDPASCRSICARCPVKASCEAAGRTEHYGVWGGRDRDAARTTQRRYRDRERKRKAQQAGPISKGAFMGLLAERNAATITDHDAR